MSWLRAIYEYAGRHFDKYEISEKSIDMEIDLQHWHFCYLRAVERIIGHNCGTGGLSGVDILCRSICAVSRG